MKLRTDDEVIVISGKDKGKTGKIIRVALLDPKDHKPTRVGTRRTEQGTPMRVTKRSGTEID
jgi:large subunit ribosomal protein L24